MTPTCARCHQSLDPLTSVPSPQGPVHAACARPVDARVPVFDEREVGRSAPKYGAPPLRNPGVWLAIVGVGTAFVMLLRRCGG